MKTTSFSCLALFGAIASLGSLPLAAQNVTDPQPAASSAAAPAEITKAPGQPKAPRLSAGLDDIVKLASAKVDESVILAYIQSSRVSYRPSAQELIKLKEVGVSSPVITALLQRGNEVRESAAQAQKEAASRAAAASAPVSTTGQSSATTAPAAPSVQPATTEAATVYYPPNSYPATYPAVYSGYPNVIYASNPAYYRNSLVIGYGGYYYPGYSYNYGCYSYPRLGYSGGYGYRGSCFTGYSPHFSVGVRFGGGHGGHFVGGHTGHFGGHGRFHH